MPDKRQAESLGQRAKDALLWCGARLKIGIDVGRDKLSGVVTEAGKQWLRQQSSFPRIPRS